MGLVLAQLCASHLSAQSTVIIDDATITPLYGLGQYLTLTNSVNPSEGRPGLFTISITSPGASQFLFGYAGIAEEYALFAVASGAVIDPAFVTSTTPIVSNNGIDPGSSLQVFSFNQSKLFGYWDDRPLNGNGTPDINDNYGWVLITRTASGLQVSSSATAIGGGIIAGTLTPVPEPSPAILLSLAAGLFLCLRRFDYVSRTPPSEKRDAKVLG